MSPASLMRQRKPHLFKGLTGFSRGKGVRLDFRRTGIGGARQFLRNKSFRSGLRRAQRLHLIRSQPVGQQYLSDRSGRFAATSSPPLRATPWQADRFPSRSMTNHPRPFRRKRLRPIRRPHRRLRRLPAATPTPRPVLVPRRILRTGHRRICCTFVGGVGAAGGAVHRRQRGRAEHDAVGRRAAVRAGAGFVALAHGAQGGEVAAVFAEVFVGRHDVLPVAVPAARAAAAGGAAVERAQLLS